MYIFIYMTSMYNAFICQIHDASYPRVVDMILLKTFKQNWGTFLETETLKFTTEFVETQNKLKISDRITLYFLLHSNMTSLKNIITYDFFQ